IMNVISQLFSAKQVKAKRTRAGRIALIDAGATVRGGMPAIQKKRFAEHQTEIAGADMLKSARCASLCRLASQKEMTSPSRAVMAVPAAGPYSRTAVKTNVSEIDIDAYDDGRRTVAEPLISVSVAMMNHSYPMG